MKRERFVVLGWFLFFLWFLLGFISGCVSLKLIKNSTYDEDELDSASIFFRCFFLPIIVPCVIYYYRDRIAANKDNDEDDELSHLIKKLEKDDEE